MMLLLTTALAPMLFAQSRMSDPSAWISADDYPAAARAAGDEGQVTMALAVDRTGRVSNCHIENAERTSLAEASCALVVARARYTPAFDREGNPIASRDRISLVWSLDGGAPSVDFSTDYGGAVPVVSPREWVVAGELPSSEVDRTSPGQVGVRFTISPEGRVGNCLATHPSGSPLINRTVCELITSRARFDAPIAADGERFQTIGRTTVKWCTAAPPERVC